MPQLDVTTWPSQLFWLAVTFIALYVVISRIAIPRTGGAIAKRRSTIEGDLASAQRLKGETDRAIAAYEEALSQARAKASAIGAEARAALNAEIDGERAKLDAALAGKIQNAEKRIAAAKGKAMADVSKVAAEIAGSIVAELTGAKVTKTALAAAVAKAAK
ncbi:MAG: ATP F0F1 synthase subunit B [Alphaproteobacteria bacterium]|nr:ATP F0F1 synthase subunit B [Alphaproteobacteria bacterium]